MAEFGAPMKLSRTVAYAVRATLQLAERGSETPVPCNRLAAEGQMPERFLLQILRSLVTHGILRSTRGVEGGYTLARQLEEISLLDIIEAIEGPLQTEPVDVVDDNAQQERLMSALREISQTTRRQLDAIRLSQFVCPDADRAASSDILDALREDDAGEDAE